MSNFHIKKVPKEPKKGLPPNPILKNVCYKCKSWTTNEKHRHYKCYTHECPAYIRDNKSNNK